MNETKASLRENLRALPRAAWILFFGTFLNKFGAFVLPFLAIYMKRLGFTAAESGLAIAGYGVGTLCACWIGGFLADRLGRRKTIVLSMFWRRLLCSACRRRAVYQASSVWQAWPVCPVSSTARPAARCWRTLCRPVSA